MIQVRNKHFRFAKLILVAILLCFAFIVNHQQAFAANSTSINAYSQGATLTEKYFVFTTCSDCNSSFKINRCDRSGFNNCKVLGDYSQKPSSMYHEWGTNYAQVIIKENNGMYCFQLDPFKKVEDEKCGEMMRSSGLDEGTKTLRQGWSKYGNCYLRGYGNNSGMTNYIQLYNAEKSKTNDWAVPHSGGEIEDVMSDGNGQIWYTYALNGSTLTYYKMDETTSSQWAGKCNPTTSNSSSTDGSSKREANDSAARKKTASDYDTGYTPSVSTYDGVVETTFFGTMQDDKEGCGVYTTLDLVMTILTIGIGIAAAIGITISGIIYLTAKGDVAKTTKAKRRILEIVIGLAVYSVIWAFLTFLLPEFNPELKACKTLTAEEIAARNAKIEAIRAENQARQQKVNQQTSSDETTSSADYTEWYQAIKDAAKYMKNAEYGSNPYADYKRAKNEATCITYPSIALQVLGVIPANNYVWYSCGLTGAKNYIKKHKNVFQVTYPNKTVKELYKKGKIQKGDIVFYQYGSACGVGHTMIFMGFKGGKPIFNTFGHPGMQTGVEHSDGSRKVTMLIHLKPAYKNARFFHKARDYILKDIS